MDSWRALPDRPSAPRGRLSERCLQDGARDLRSLGRRLCELPYGRGAERAAWTEVLTAGQGTCSTKHAFLAAVAAENDVPLELMLGLYEMHARNTPGVGESLAAAGLACIPEAHCYVRWQSRRIDVTRADAPPSEPLRVLREEPIAPAQVVDYKVAWHRRELRAWCEARGLSDWRGVWAVRERCIAALSRVS